MKPGCFLKILALILVISPVLALKETTIYMPAVQETDYGEIGAMATLTVSVKAGSGHVYVDTWPLAKIDTQASARIAKQVSCDLLSIDCSGYDFFYTIRSDAEIVGGPSGGAAMSVATLASILDLKIDNNVLITGTINPDGSIGPVSGILEKAEVSAEKGKTFLLPEGTSTVKIEKKDTDIGQYARENWNLTVIEVSNIEDAFGYFTKYEMKEKKVEFKRTEEYQDVMRKFGQELIAHAKILQQECLNLTKKAKIDYKSRDEISELCSKAPEEAQKEFERKNYYSAASLAFADSISYRYGIKLIDFLSSPDKKEFSKEYLDSLGKEELEINTTNIELYAIIEERASEVQENLDLAWKEYYSANYTNAVYYGAFTEERMHTAKLWNEHSGEFPTYIETSSEELNAISNDVISEAYAILTYTNLLSANAFSFESDRLVEKARDSQKKEKYYTAIILALKAKSNAEIASEIYGKEDYGSLVELHKKRALLAIDQTNSVIGQSYFEYARTLEETNKGASLVYYTYSEHLSKLNSLVNKKPNENRIEPSEFLEPNRCNYEKPFTYLNYLVEIFLSFFFLI